MLDLPYSLTADNVGIKEVNELLLKMSSRILQRVGNRCSPGRDGFPISKIADLGVDLFDYPFLDDVQHLSIKHTVKDHDVAGPDTIGKGL